MFIFFIFFFNDTATTEIYTLSLHDALPIYELSAAWDGMPAPATPGWRRSRGADRVARFSRTRRPLSRQGRPASPYAPVRSEEHTSELQSLAYLVCRLLLEKKKDTTFSRLVC